MGKDFRPAPDICFQRICNRQSRLCLLSEDYIKKLAMILIEEMVLANGLHLNIFDCSREIAADTVKVEVVFKADIALRESYFSAADDCRLVKDIFGDQLTYEYKMERTFVPKDNGEAVRAELINTFKENSLGYVAADNFAQKFCLAGLRNIRKNHYNYQRCQETKT